MSAPRIGHTEGGHSFAGGDPSDSANWKKIGVSEDGYKFSGGDPSSKDNWEPEIDNETEASLGIANRSQYAIEPIQSNRKAFLEREFGQENILQDKSGDLYLKQDGKFLPLNKNGVSTADFADLGGALPEMVGGVAGTGLGLVAGVPTGGTASIPLAAGMGATGAGAGSIARQGLSAMLGTPQVATMGERAAETGLSVVAGGITGGASAYLKPIIAKTKTNISNFLKGLGGDALEKITDSTADTTTKTVSKSGVELAGEITPHKQTAKEIMGELADRSGEEIVQQEKKKLQEIALKEGLPDPSYAMAAQDTAILAENKIMNMKFLGRNVRQMATKQAKLIKDNLEKITGKSIDADSDVRTVGQIAKEYAETVITGTKKIATELYQKVDEDGANAMIGKRTLFNKYRDYAGKNGLINPDGSRAAFDATAGLDEETFNIVQKSLFQAMDALNRNVSPKIRFADANGLLKTMKGTLKRIKTTDANAHRILNELKHNLDDTMEGILNREHPNLGKIFGEANKTYRNYKTQQTVVEKMIGNLDDEKVVARVMNSTGNIKALQEVIGDERVKDLAKSHVADILFKLNKSGIARADTAMDAIRKSSAYIQDALGKETYDSLMRNLHYLNRTGRPLTLSRTNLYNVMDNRGGGWKGALVSLKGAADTIATSKGTTTGKAITKAVAKPSGKVFETTGKVINRATGASNLPGIGNALSDGKQRSLSAIPNYASSRITEREKEIKRRKRAISGSK